MRQIAVITLMFGLGAAASALADENAPVPESGVDNATTGAESSADTGAGTSADAGAESGVDTDAAVGAESGTDAGAGTSVAL